MRSDLSEKQGDKSKLELRDALFNDFIETNQLLEPLCKDKNFTWTNKQKASYKVLEKLDRYCIITMDRGGPYLTINSFSSK